MGIIDIIILVVLVSFAIIGFKRGVIHSLVSFVGFILVIYLAYLVKNYLGDIFVLNLPFLNFKIGSISSQVMNIVMYQSVAFIIMMIAFGLIYKFLMIISGIIEKILKMTIILDIPSKILGLIVGALEGYIVVYLLLFFLVQPYVKMNILNESKYASTILTKTPVLNGFANNTLEIIEEVNTMVKNNDTDNFDLRLSELILKYKVTSAETMQKLVDIKKIEVESINDVINKYKNGGEQKVND